MYPMQERQLLLSSLFKKPVHNAVRRFSCLYKSICCGYSFELHRQVDAIQMSTHNICLYKEVARKYTCCNLKTTELLDCAFRGMCGN